MALFGVVGTMNWHHLVDTSMKASMLANSLSFYKPSRSTATSALIVFLVIKYVFSFSFFSIMHTDTERHHIKHEIYIIKLQIS